MKSYNQEKLTRLEHEEWLKQLEKEEAEAEAKARAEQDIFETRSFIRELKKSRLICIIKTAITIALFVAASVLFTKSLLASLVFFALFLVVKKFVQIGSSVIGEYYNGITGRYELGDQGFLGFLVGLVVAYALLLGVQALNDFLFPPYFFIMPFAILVGLVIWLLGPILSDIYFIIESSVMIKNPPLAETFSLSEYTTEGKVGRFINVASKIKIFAVLALIIGALLTQTVQYSIEAPKLLAELDRQAVYAKYSEENAVVKIPEEEFENPDERDYKRFKAKCIDTYIFDIDNGGVKTYNEVTVTYNYDNGWKVTDYEAYSSILSVELSGTWKGMGRDAHFGTPDYSAEITVTIDRMTETEAEGSMSSIIPGNPEAVYKSKFTATVEQVKDRDDDGILQTYYVMSATTEEERSWGEKGVRFTYNVGTDKLSVSHNYEALLTREK